MKLKQIIIFVFCTSVISSCQPPLVFDKPQPSGVNPLSEIPKMYQGVYWCKVDSVALLIDNTTIFRQKQYETILTKSEIEASPDLVLQNGQLYDKNSKQTFPSKINEDTVIASIVFKDTIFSLSPEQVIKTFKGHLILSKKLDEHFWEVMIVSHKNDASLSISRADLPENLAKLDSVTTIERIENDMEQIMISPTKAEFNQILKRGLIFEGSCREYKPILLKEVDLIKERKMVGESAKITS